MPLTSRLIRSTFRALPAAVALAAIFVAHAAALRGETLRLSAEAFGEPVRILLRGVPTPEGRAAAEAAGRAILEVEHLTDLHQPVPGAQEGEPPAPGNLAALNAAAGQGARPVAPELLELLSRALSFCTWSEGAQGPLGGRLEEIWGLESPVAQPPIPDDLQQATVSASCSQLLLDPKHGLASLAAGSLLSLRNFAPGFAIDRAISVLQDRGVSDALVEVGKLRRAMGGGAEGKGWRVTLPVFPGMSEPLDEIWLRDQSLAIAHYEDGTLRAGTNRYPPYIHQRSGRPMEGVLAVVAMSELAVDAQGLATTLFVMGNREGQFRLGMLRPSPAALWLLGSGEGNPLITDYHWTGLGH